MSEHTNLPAAVEALRRHIAGGAVVAGPDDDAEGLWHETGRRPAVRVECVDASDVATAVRIAVDNALAVAGAAVPLRRWVSYAESVSDDEDVLWPVGRRWAEMTRNVGRLDGPLAEVLVAGARTMPSPRSVIFLHGFHGAPTHVAPEATAFPLRRDHFVLAVIALVAAHDGSAWERASAWTEELADNLEPFTLPGGYVNFLSPNDTDQVAAFYGDSLGRLEAVKKRVDPYRVFTSVTGAGALT